MIPLTDKLRSKNKNITWTVKDQSIIDSVKEQIVNAATLHHTDLTKTFIIKTDASELAIGVILEQEGKVIRFFSYKLKGSKKNYTIMEKKICAIVKALE